MSASSIAEPMHGKREIGMRQVLCNTQQPLTGGMELQSEISERSGRMDQRFERFV